MQRPIEWRDTDEVRSPTESPSPLPPRRVPRTSPLPPTPSPSQGLAVALRAAGGAVGFAGSSKDVPQPRPRTPPPRTPPPPPPCSAVRTPPPPPPPPCSKAGAAVSSSGSSASTATVEPPLSKEVLDILVDFDRLAKGTVSFDEMLWKHDEVLVHEVNDIMRNMQEARSLGRKQVFDVVMMHLGAALLPTEEVPSSSKGDAVPAAGGASMEGNAVAQAPKRRRTEAELGPARAARRRQRAADHWARLQQQNAAQAEELLTSFNKQVFGDT